ncbi:hypothetical protein [Intrasporangium flavum]|uniref:hypothetical protein n=1 Tax=Intrasporangium flavum TaxID=1428657 RepID=UPI00096DC147|nr:hypothetical protein [Intrasporangium flavum]
MHGDTDREPSRRRAVVVTLVASVLLVTGGLLALKRSVDEDLPRFPPPTPTSTSSPPAAG